MRLFIAIDIDSRIEDSLTNLRRQIQKRVVLGKNDVKWVEPENIHLTLKFLGEVKDDGVAGLCSIVEEVVGRFKNFDLDIGQGYFGAVRQQKVRLCANW